MATGKKTFIFYSDWINMIREMPNEDAGALLKHVLSYVNDEDPETDNLLVKMAFGHMKPLLKADLDKWDKIRETRRQSGSKGGKAKAKQMLANAKQVEAVNDNVNVNVNVNDNKNVNDSFKKEYSQEVLQTFDECLNLFPLHLHPKTKSIKNNWLDTVEKLIRIEKIPPDKIIEIVKKTRSDDFWSKNFLALPKLRKKNKDGIMNIVVFNERIKNETNKRTNSTGADPDELAELYAAKFAKFNQGK